MQPESELGSLAEDKLSALTSLPIPPAGHSADKTSSAIGGSHECPMPTGALQPAKRVLNGRNKYT